jgi:peptidyl-prolyl cis-trans isomerase C
MKPLSIVFLFSALLLGQAQEPVKVTPGMPAAPPPISAATPPPPVTPDTVVLEVDGKKITAAELDKILNGFPAGTQQTLRARPQLLSQLFWMQKLAEDAEKAGLDQQSPYKEQLDGFRLQLLANAETTYLGNTLPVTEEDERKYYQDNPDKFKEVKVRVIYVTFNPAAAKPAADGKKRLTEAEAKAKIENLAIQIKGGGADFGMLARENSDDPASAGKDGDFGIIKQDSSFPKELITAVFALKQGETSVPVRVPNGFYLIRAEQINQKSFDDARPQIAPAVRKEHLDAQLKVLQAKYNVKIENPAYFAPRAPAQLQQVH